MGEGVVGIYIGVCMGYRGGIIYYIYIIYRGVCIGVGGYIIYRCAFGCGWGVGYGLNLCTCGCMWGGNFLYKRLV